jgi:nicotinamidase-related amidase
MPQQQRDGLPPCCRFGSSSCVHDVNQELLLPQIDADWLDRFKPYIEDGKTIVVAPHRVWGPETNDLVLQLRKRKISKIILGGMLANMCVESHLRELLEQGFEVAVAKDATAAPKHPEWGYGYEAALINYAYLAHAVLTTDQAVKAMERGRR